MAWSRSFLFNNNVKPVFRDLYKFRNIFSVSGLWESELSHDINKRIEEHWKEKINIADIDHEEKEKFYLLSMFPYPSGHLHMGHVRVYTISDAFARFYRMQGKTVIHPIGWDAFGLPAENAAINRNIHPAEWTAKNIAAMKKQLQLFNISFDWDKELSTCDSSYYKWTQYLFLLLYEKGLAYKKMAVVNWDPVDETVLADEQVDENGFSWRSGCKVEKKMFTQWFLRTTQFAKNLYDGLKDEQLLEWRDVINIQQNWIGDCNGFTLQLKLFKQGVELSDTISIWTDTPELIYGASFISLAPDHLLNTQEFDGGDKSGTLQLNIEVLHPLTGNLLPVFVSDEFNYPPATQSFLGIPSSKDEISFGFALRHELDIIPVTDSSSKILINSEEFSRLPLKEAKDKIIEKVIQTDTKVHISSRNLRDWLISRQRYWGTPIPMINCPNCQIVPVPFEDLPVVLPEVEFSGKINSLKAAKEWIEVKCPRCGGAATRETDTMDTFVDSSWYFLRYLDNHNSSQPFSTEKTDQLMPVDLYIGGKEHAYLHLFYARFMSHFLHSVGMLKSPEPFIQLLMQGMVQGQSYKVESTGKYIPKEEVDFSVSPPVEKCSELPLVIEWEKMSKSKFNGIDPEEVIEKHGIDTTRLFVLGNVVPQSDRKWNDELFPGIWNFQRRLWLTMSDFLMQKKGEGKIEPLTEEEFKIFEGKLLHNKNYYIKRATHAFLHTNQLSVAIAKLQGMTGDLRRQPKILARDSAVYQDCLAVLLIMLAPLAPHFASELWTAFCSVATTSKHYDLGKLVLQQKWPVRDKNSQLELKIRVNNNLIEQIIIPDDEMKVLDKRKATKLAFDSENVKEISNTCEVRAVTFKNWPDNDAEMNILVKPSDLKKVMKAKRNDRKVQSLQ